LLVKLVTGPGERGVYLIEAVARVQKATAMAFWYFARELHVLPILNPRDPHIPLAPRAELPVRDLAISSPGSVAQYMLSEVMGFLADRFRKCSARSPRAQRLKASSGAGTRSLGD
jgi:hypothetical protein